MVFVYTSARGTGRIAFSEAREPGDEAAAERAAECADIVDGLARAPVAIAGTDARQLLPLAVELVEMRAQDFRSKGSCAREPSGATRRPPGCKAPARRTSAPMKSTVVDLLAELQSRLTGE